MRVGIIGIGGVGGYYGGMLAKFYANYDDVDLIFIARNKTRDAINKNGLKLKTVDGINIVYPALVSDDIEKIGELDFVICCVKGFDLEESLLSIKQSITTKTVILPLLNGVDLKARILSLFPQNDILDGCVYLVSRVIEPGVIEQIGSIHKLYFGSKIIDRNTLVKIERLFNKAAIECYLEDDIERIIWEKFIFVSSIASLTAYLDLSIGEILINETHSTTLKELLAEVSDIARQKEINIPINIVESTYQKMKGLPFETTSSMHYDFQKVNRTELGTLTEHVSKLGKELGAKTPVYDKLLDDLIKR